MGLDCCLTVGRRTSITRTRFTAGFCAATVRTIGARITVAALLIIAATARSGAIQFGEVFLGIGLETTFTAAAAKLEFPIRLALHFIDVEVRIAH